MSEKERGRAVVMLVFAALLWSIGGVLIKWVEWHPLAIAGARSLIAAAFLAIFLRGAPWPRSRAETLGALAYAATVVLFVVANKMTTAANAILLQYTAPVWVALFGGLLLGERATLRDWLTVAAVLGGMTLFLYDGLSGGRLAGNVVALLSGVAFASLALAMRRDPKASPLRALAAGNVLAFFVGLPFFFEGPPPDARGLLGLALLGVVQLGLSYLLYAKAVAHVTALELILIPVIEPLLNPVWTFLVIGESPGALAAVGGAVVLGAVTLRGFLEARARGAGAWSHSA